MNGFYITVSNGLLIGDHQERMGAAIWQYMWLLDKITKIDDKGFGWILGGKPINLKDIAGNKSKVTISRNLNKLEKEGYIIMTHTMYGIIIKVTKAKKRFNKNDNPRIITNDKTRNENDNPRFINDNPNKTVSVDKTIDNNNKQRRSVAGKKRFFNPLGEKIIKAFEEVDPKNKTYYGNTTQRGACNFLLAEYGLEEVLKRVSVLRRTNKISFFPTINSPNDLKEKWVKLQDAVDRKRGELSKTNNVAFK